MGDGQKEEPKSSKNMRHYKTEPIETSNSQSQPGKNPDPYVTRAVNRAKTKIRDRMFQLNGGHVH